MFSRFLDLIARYQLALILAALAAGLVWPSIFLPLNPWNGFFLQVIMFSTGLRLDFVEFMKQAKDWRTLVLANSMMLVILPFLVALPLAFFAPEWTLPFVLAAAMPAGLTAPAVIAILGGKTSLAILIAVSTSVLSPFTIPLVLRVMAGQTVTIDVTSMMANIAWVVIVPLALSALVQWKIKRKRIERFVDPIRLANLAAFALVIASVAASSAGPTGAPTVTTPGAGFLGIGTDGVIIVILMTVFWIGIAWLASAMLAWRDTVDRMTVSFCLIYMNTTLGVWIADKFFRETGIAPKLVAIFIATTLILPVFKLFVPKEKKKTFRKVYAVEQM
ncbi:MAG TPA: bile acid:sodium symporter [Candidatus Methylomirabilis sp.]|nr:bile acid:sodium symporter [Candidatus Methylomirabilis sp.]